MLTPARKQFKCSKGLIKTTYMMPDWLTRDLVLRRAIGFSSFSEVCASIRETSIANEVSAKFWHISGDMIIRWEGDLKNVELVDVRSERPISYGKVEMILVRKKSAASWRRELMVSIAMMLQRNINPPFTDCEIDTQYLNCVIDDPISVEKQALEIWNNFVDDCNMPKSFLDPTRRPIILSELLIYKRRDTSHAREIFTEKFPWIVRSMLTSYSVYRNEFQMLDADPTCSKYLAAKHVCCREESACQKAQKLIKRLPRKSKHAEFDQLLENINYRQLLLEAHNDDTEIITHMGENISLVKQQFEHALKASQAYLDSVSRHGVPTAFYFATLLARMMIRNKYVPDVGFNFDVVAKGLALVSADCLAVFIAKSWNHRMQRLTGGNTVLDEGVLALVNFIGKRNPPHLTINQLIRFAIAVNPLHENGLHLLKNISYSSWIIPRELDVNLENIASRYEGLKIQCLTDAKKLFAEGLAMRNCLRDGYYIRSTVKDRLVLFSIIFPDHRATLALLPQFSECETLIVDWEIDELEGNINKYPSDDCYSVASDILDHFRKNCCIQLSQKEIDRLDCISANLEQIKFSESGYLDNLYSKPVINADVVDAKNRWKQVYSKLLPRSLSNVDPELIVEEHLASLEIYGSDSTCDITIEELMDRADSLSEQS